MTAKEHAMKLDAAMVTKALYQYDARVLPEAHPAMPELSKRFGDHTFFLDENGLNIVEPTEPEELGQAAGVVVNLASWADEQRSSLELHRPEVTDLVLELGPADPDDAA
jgi:hypothetical protein